MRSLAAALKDFGAPPLAAADPFVSPPGFSSEVDFPVSEPFEFPQMPAAQTVDVDAVIAEAVAQAEAALAERLSDEHAQALQSERDRHAEEVAELHNRFAEEAGAKILQRIEEMENHLIELTSAITARILGVVLTDDIRKRSIERLAAIIREALSDGEAIRIRVRGSLPLYEELKKLLPTHAAQLEFSESANFDLSVTIDDSVFETRLAEWSSALAGTLS